MDLAASPGQELHLRPTASVDLTFVLAAEQHPDNASFVGQWSQERHQAAIADADEEHLMIMAGPHPVGYTLLQGLSDSNGVVQLRRLVITQKGCGYGRTALALIQRRVFCQYRAHRLWLDVKSYNPRAQHLYTQMGFVHEGCLRECLKLDQGHASLNLMGMLRHEFEPHLGDT